MYFVWESHRERETGLWLLGGCQKTEKEINNPKWQTKSNHIISGVDEYSTVYLNSIFRLYNCNIEAYPNLKIVIVVYNCNFVA